MEQLGSVGMEKSPPESPNVKKQQHVSSGTPAQPTEKPKQVAFKRQPLQRLRSSSMQDLFMAELNQKVKLINSDK